MTATILVVDDLEPNIRLLEAKLLGEYYNVLTARSGKEAIDIIAHNKVDIILLDVMMPEMDGFEACRFIKESSDFNHIPVIMVTALSDIEDKIKGLESGADEFLTKPINDVALFARVKSLATMKNIIDELKLRNTTNYELAYNINKSIEYIEKSRILIIDDNVIQSKNISLMLQDITCNIKTIFNSSFPIEQEIIQYHPDLIILSSHINNIDSLRLSVNLRAQPTLANVPLILMAEDDNNPIVIKAIELGINDYFVYPVDQNELIARIKTQLRKKYYQESLKQSLETSVNMSIKDSLTDVYNRRYFDNHIHQALYSRSHSKKFNSPLALMMIDIDNFKNINDNYGHLIGDFIIKSSAELIAKSLSNTDILARYGGEEFVILSYHLDKNQAQKLATKIRKDIENTRFFLPGSKQSLAVTISIGITMYTPQTSSEEFISRADQALYYAKNTGRNKCVII